MNAKHVRLEIAVRLCLYRSFFHSMCEYALYRTHSHSEELSDCRSATHTAAAVSKRGMCWASMRSGSVYEPLRNVRAMCVCVSAPM